MSTQHTHGGPTAARPDRHLPAGSAADGPYALRVDPERAGWTHSSLRVLELEPGGTHTLDTGDSEWIVLPLNGGCAVEVDGTTFELLGRESVFGGVTDFAYLPRSARAQITSGAGGRFALAGAKCGRRLPARYGPAPEVPVELRGSGTCSRQVNNFAAADSFDCDRLIAVEVLTPGGNWSSYPPHKHDEHRPGSESVLEEIYYFEIERDGLGYQRVSPSRDGGTDVLAEVRGGDAVLIPDGWHGPSIAPPGRTLYYLNVMAGPGATREWLICDHPDHAWIRGTWPQEPVDPRLPLYLPPAAASGSGSPAASGNGSPAVPGDGSPAPDTARDGDGERPETTEEGA
ncbi:5-deoxy-glucuronate isomerase [Streptomyces clavuligerus]|uniref:Putative IolB protein n=1 Tax=Streptomyces clavuligerus TaxID=1901 RepID=B5GV50_STRCL|nr:5-deoxy-glucuronate isomerase [Streptomyces clavuligerus]ANW20120.1 5-deoxy-glucuronate isomerase [Streptomyces clavuligerus]AXU14746.1 5-deoxy-glucuronate isomerase [Streptomyces clavuligerus]EDY50196.1 IolB protein [Streptomyces clavuligerus]EFG06974.1 Putative IolB protein [Streptomyces clavuligerus]MBY6304773.1 5-deoxy-glucuronate isomerase [Streptomyces clavuligerus]